MEGEPRSSISFMYSWEFLATVARKRRLNCHVRLIQICGHCTDNKRPYCTDPGPAAEVWQDPGEAQGTAPPGGESHVSWCTQPHEHNADVHVYCTVTARPGPFCWWVVLYEITE